VKSQVDLKHRQLRRGTTEKQVERLTTDLAKAHSELAQARQKLGEDMGDGRDTRAAMDELTRAESRVKALEAARTVAQHKDAEALRTLKDAQLVEKIAGDDAVVAALKAAVLELEEGLGGVVKPAADKVGACLQAVKDRSEGNQGVGSALIDFNAWFPVYLDRYCNALIPRGGAYSQVLDRDGKKFSEWVGAIEYAMAARRKGR
jgi:hypothetical protein